MEMTGRNQDATWSDVTENAAIGTSEAHTTPPLENQKYYEVEHHGGVEDPNEYYPGGFHPVLLGDYLGNNNRFRVINKLGAGAYGTVWLCSDRTTGKWRAVKIFSAKVSRSTADIDPHELPDHRTTAMADMVISKHLAQWYQPDDPALKKHHIGIPLEYFWIHGPNGNHLCHVSPLYGPTIEHLHDLYSPCPSFLKEIAYQLVDSMAFLHQHGICHGDFRPANIMFRLLSGVDEWPEEKMVKLYGKPSTVRVHAVDEEGQWDFEVESNVPPYLIQSANFNLASGACSNDIAVIDFGMAYFLDNPPTSCAIPFELSSPEGIFTNGRLGWPADIWALACTLLMTVAGSYPFGDEDPESTPWLVVEDMERLMGPMPLRYRPLLTTCVSAGRQLSEQQMSDPSRYATFNRQEPQASIFHDNRDIIRNRIFVNHMIPWSSEEYEELAKQDKIWSETGRLPKYIKPAGIEGETIWRPSPLHDREDGEGLVDLLVSIFKWEPTERATARRLLAHSWFESRQSRSSGSQPAVQQGWSYLAMGKGLVWVLGGLFLGMLSFRLRKRLLGN
ncbi:kinase-like domain-containing protein [Cercophora samala]|uniref:EKC/KEOPS complex subunit BUD32 n=1 Tax=Cercophora samala TaxID=330535 RepID=A0AA39Z585_9PEZI|nr:kinase-like domain-containing protein [Cercophora samala]